MSESFVEQTQGYLYNLSELVQAKTAIFAQIPSVPANIAGLLAVAVLMYGACIILTNKKAEAYDK